MRDGFTEFPRPSLGASGDHVPAGERGGIRWPFSLALLSHVIPGNVVIFTGPFLLLCQGIFNRNLLLMDAALLMALAVCGAMLIFMKEEDFVE